MKQNMRNSSSGANNVLRRLGADKKKTVTALCLVAVMVFMWARMLGKKTPQSAQATPASIQTNLNGEPGLESNITFIELPMVTGRNDVLNRDFFDAKDWQSFFTDGQGRSLTDTEAGDAPGNEEVVRRLTEKLNLEAIELGEHSLAFINQELLSAGDKLSLRDGDNTYECEVVRIEENKVSIRCGDVQIELELTEASDVNG